MAKGTEAYAKKEGPTTVIGRKAALIHDKMGAF